MYYSTQGVASNKFHRNPESMLQPEQIIINELGIGQSDTKAWGGGGGGGMK